MKKKQVIGLSILFAVFLLGLSTTSYANIYRQFTENDFKNFLYNAWINNNTEEDVLSAIQTHENNGNITTIVDLLNQYDYCLLTVQTGSSGWNFVEIGLTPSDKHLYWYSNKPAVKNSDNCFKYQLYFNGLFQKTWGFSYSYEVRTNYIYYGMPRYQSSSSNTIVNSGGSCYPSTDIFDGPYQDSLPFAFVSDTGLGTVTYDNYEYTLFNKPSSGDILLGQLFVPNGIVVNYLDVLNYYWYWNNWQVREFDDSFIRTQLVSNNDGDLVFNVYLKREHIYTNTYYQYIFTSHSTEPYQFVSGGCYIKDSHTIITNNTVDPYNTFSGDYKDEYDSIIDNQQDVNNIISGTEPILDFFSNTNIPSGEEPTFNDLPSINIDDDSEEFFTWLLQSFLSVLNNNSNTNLVIPLFNTDYSIPSNFYVLDIEPLRTFINLGWWFICGVPFLKFIRSSIEKLKGGNIPLADEKSDLLGHII